MSDSPRSLPAAIQRLPLSRKILAVTFLSSLVTLVAFCSVSFYRDWVNFKQRKIAQLSTLALILESNTAASLRFDDPYTAKEYVDSMRHEPDFRSVCIYYADGRTFAHFSREPRDAPRPSPTFEGPSWQDDSLLYARSVKLDDAVIGRILFELDTQSLKASILRSFWTSLALLAGGLAITLILASRLQRHITEPVQDLVEATRRNAARKDFASLARKHHDDEIGSLADSFNDMLRTLSQQDATLRANNTTLERTVQERTEDLRQRNEALSRAMEAANAASVAKSEFLAMASHELRTPLNPIIGYVDLLLRDQPDPESARKLDLIKHSARLLLRLIDDILDFSRIERGTVRLEADTFAFRSQLEQMVDSMLGQARKKTLSLRYQHCKQPGEGDDTPHIVADEVRLRQIALNLVGNAIKFTHQGGITVRTFLLPDPLARPSFRRLRLEVSDTGIGISQADKQKLFKPFSQIDGTWTREYGGLGLGLAISSKIVDAMKGSIQCQSEKGVGSTFSVEVPVEIHIPLSEDKPHPAQDPAQTYDILLVEDEPVNRELMRALLASMGHRVVSAVDGVEAMERFHEQAFHLVLLDISMPRMDGFATARAIRASENRSAPIPIVAMTAHVTPEDKDRCLNAGMDDYLSKPLSLSKLKAMLKKWLSQNPAKTS